MGIDIKFWKNRVTSRIDLTTQVVHLTRPSEDESASALENLISILKSQTIYGSTKSSGFIVGSGKAVCFQDAPLISLAQNIEYEQKIRREAKNPKIRYSPIGLMFAKAYVYRKGGRPVFYEKTAVAKNLLPSTEHWRIVNFDISDDDNIVDWTHEREWRVPGDFEFDLKEATIIVGNSSQYKKFSKLCNEVEEDQNEPNYLDAVKLVVPLSSVML